MHVSRPNERQARLIAKL